MPKIPAVAECLEMEERAEDPAQLGCTGVTITGIWWPLHRAEGVHGPSIDFAGLVQGGDVGFGVGPDRGIL